MPNDLDFVALVVERLAGGGARPLVFGGWAEELTGLIAPRQHADIDLLLPAASLPDVHWIAGATEIRAKRFAHKRAFVMDCVTIEVTLVQNHPQAPVTYFWGDVPYYWLKPLSEPELPLAARGFVAVSRENLIRYRSSHEATQPWRWRDPASLVD